MEARPAVAGSDTRCCCEAERKAAAATRGICRGTGTSVRPGADAGTGTSGGNSGDEDFGSCPGSCSDIFRADGSCESASHWCSLNSSGRHFRAGCWAHGCSSRRCRCTRQRCLLEVRPANVHVEHSCKCHDAACACRFKQSKQRCGRANTAPAGGRGCRAWGARFRFRPVPQCCGCRCTGRQRRNRQGEDGECGFLGPGGQLHGCHLPRGLWWGRRRSEVLGRSCSARSTGGRGPGGGIASRTCSGRCLARPA
mmetsp:Transcript_26312/g.83294  ORF Transcript_26312/g.83294 Transcript_26312/m.83294 type:complete len:253 (+) Transcript_26312:528-1286(+)